MSVCVVILILDQFDKDVVEMIPIAEWLTT